MEEVDHCVAVVFKIEKNALGYPKSRDFEALFCRPLDEEATTCRIMSVPFFLKNVAYGDTIETEVDPETDGLNFSRVLIRGGYSIYRIYLHDQSKKEALLEKLFSCDALVEITGNLLAFAVLDSNYSDALYNYIMEGKSLGYWGAQDGFIFEP